jgi:outer membrane protein OmpA-like peptidoglycan-associated protein
MKRMMLRPAGLALLFWSVIATPLTGQSVESQLDDAGRRIEEARARLLFLIAPRSFSLSVEKYQEAQAKLQRGSRPDDIQRSLSEVDTRLTQAELVEEHGRDLLRVALEARDAALAANAPEAAAEEWQAAERKMIEAGREVESRKDDQAQRKGAEAVTLYQASEFTAIRVGLLGPAHDLRVAALEAKVDELAIASFVGADSVLQQAETVLREDRYAGATVGALAREASERFNHAMTIAAVVERVDRNRKPAVEALILEHEAAVARVADSLGFESSFVDGLAPVTAQILIAIESLYRERDALRDDLATRSAELDSSQRDNDDLQERMLALRDSLQGKLSEIEESEREAREILRERLRRDAVLLRVERMFPVDKAEVVSTPNELAVRMFGLTFPVGSAEIQPENFALLTTLQRAIAEFPSGTITIEGHTDSQGNAASNQALSQRRADAVRNYLLANTDVDASRLTAIGFGEARPIASNDTRDGRARNRRIDVRLELPAVFD